MPDGNLGPELGANIESQMGRFNPRMIAQRVHELAQSVRDRDLKGILQNKLAGPEIQAKASLVKGKTNDLMMARAETPLGKKIYAELAKHELTKGINPDTVVEKYNQGIEELSNVMHMVTGIPEPVLETLLHGAHYTELYLNRVVMSRESWEPRVNSIKNLAARAKATIK